ncbi:right-handed parallel beta-helix repeat-containing protein [Kaarinaea lacus]
MFKKMPLLLFSLTLATSINAANLFVQSGATGTDCTNTNPCGSIQKAIDKATPGDKILIGAGTFIENVRVISGKDDISLIGRGTSTVIESAGGVNGVCAPCEPFVEADVIVDIISANVSLKDLAIIHADAVAPSKRDLGIFVRPPATDVKIKNVSFNREHLGETGVGPGSRGIFVFLATGTEIIGNTFRGTYQDAIHIPTSSATIKGNDIANAPRVGIVIVQEPGGSPAIDSIVKDNVVDSSGGDGIQIQGDSNIIKDNIVTNSGGAGIKLCGAQIGDCVEPGDTAIAAIAENNIVKSNTLSGNGEGDVVIDNGTGNLVQ